MRRSPVESGRSITGSFDWLGTAIFSRALCLMLFFLLLVTIGNSANAQEKSSSTLLQIGISHSEVLPALPPNQQVGEVFNGFDAQPDQYEEAQEQTKPSVQQAITTTPARNLPVRSSRAAQSNPKSAAAPPQRSTAKEMPLTPPASAKSLARPSQAQVAAAIQYYATQRYAQGVHQPQVSRPQSSMLQSQMPSRTPVMLNGYGWSGKAYSSSQRNSNSVKSPTERRFKIPAWMAGVWQRSDSNELSRVSLPSGKHLKAVGHNVASVKDSFGTYRDESGQIWQVFDPRKATGSIDRGTALDYSTVTDYDIIISGSDAPVVAVRATHVIVSKSTHRVVSSYQDEELNTYSKTPDGRLRTDSSVKVFDAKGKPQLLTTALSMEVQIAPFSGPVRKATN